MKHRIVPFEPAHRRRRLDRFKHKIAMLASGPRGDEAIELLELLMDALMIANPSDMKALELVPHDNFDQMMAWARAVLARQPSEPA
jgi:hypothetical protein